MKLIILCLFISISLHLLLYTDYKLTKNNLTHNKIEESKKTSSVTFVNIKKKKRENKVINKTEPNKSEVNSKKTTKKTNITKKISKILKKAPEKITYDKKRMPKTAIKKKINALEKRTLEDFLSQEDPVDIKILNQIEKLYGREFETFTKIQKAFIKNNFNNFQQVTQRVLTRLGYPRLAIKLKISGINIVQFTFHPNGNISDLRITDSSGYKIFDEYTLELIEIAYKDYPKPKTSTKLKFHVRYNLF